MTTIPTPTSPTSSTPMPTHITIGGEPVRVVSDMKEMKELNEDWIKAALEPGEEVLNDGVRAVWAYSDFPSRTIRIWPDLTPHNERHKVMHELLHFVQEEHLPQDQWLTEDQTDQVARGLYHMLRDNPCLQAYFAPTSPVTDVTFMVGECGCDFTGDTHICEEHKLGRKDAA
jgi:hypothetical protein